MNDIERKVFEHDTMLNEHESMLHKHSAEITELKEMGKQHNSRISMLEGLMRENQRLMSANAELQAKLVDIAANLSTSQKEIVASQNRMIWKIVGFTVSLVAIIGGLVAYLHM